jgi:polyferredoxin
MDACDEVMLKIDRPTGLIRYDSYNGIAQGKRRIFTTRVLAYSAFLALLLIFQGFLLSNRTAVEVLLLRTPGMLYQEVDENTWSNLYNYQIINKTGDDVEITFELVGDGDIKLIGQVPTATATEVTEGALFIELPKAAVTGHKNTIRMKVIADGEVINEVRTNFLGPQE